MLLLLMPSSKENTLRSESSMQDCRNLSMGSSRRWAGIGIWLRQTISLIFQQCRMLWRIIPIRRQSMRSARCKEKSMRYKWFYMRISISCWKTKEISMRLLRKARIWVQHRSSCISSLRKWINLAAWYSDETRKQQWRRWKGWWPAEGFNMLNYAWALESDCLYWWMICFYSYDFVLVYDNIFVIYMMQMILL